MPPPLSRRAALAGLGAVLLTGCGPEVLPAGPPPSGTAAGSPQPSPSPSPRPDVTVASADGPVTVPGGVRRVVVLDTAELDSAMTLGITPVGAAKAPLDAGPPAYWPASRLAEVAVVGDIGAAPDTAAIAALRPQLILTNLARDADHTGALRAVAPTVVTRTTGAPWKEDFQRTPPPWTGASRPPPRSPRTGGTSTRPGPRWPRPGPPGSGSAWSGSSRARPPSGSTPGRTSPAASCPTSACPARTRRTPTGSTSGPPPTSSPPPTATCCCTPATATRAATA
ncbi:hypothetical protein ACFQ2M_24475 [Kitasatospora saccharophila]|uniref:hypothetical protein n=1 Tax=Kitasatospora saccharophila TaxID=407973 RepID=UPI00364409E1